MSETIALHEVEPSNNGAVPDGGAPEPERQADRQVLELQTQGELLRRDLAQRDEQIVTLRDSLETAAMKYRQALMAAYPVIPEELLSGSTIEELEASLERARTAVDQVRRKLEEDMGRSLSVPSGAPVRRPPDASGLSPKEKILQGMRG